MSHFFVAVIVPETTEEEVEKLLSPYDEIIKKKIQISKIQKHISSRNILAGVAIPYIKMKLDYIISQPITQNLSGIGTQLVVAGMVASKEKKDRQQITASTSVMNTTNSLTTPVK